MYTSINPLPIVILLLATSVAVFSHDGQIDSAIMAALASPTNAVDYSNSPVRITPTEQHVHLKTGISAGSVIKINAVDVAAQPFNKHDKKYRNRQRLALSLPGNEYTP